MSYIRRNFLINKFFQGGRINFSLYINHFHHKMANLDTLIRKECLICAIFHLIESLCRHEM